jgi:uncharacterized protein (UPF0332 family)
MSFNWLEYFVLAQELVGQSGTLAGQEARQRSAISRAYYAAFCQARNHLRDKEGHSLPEDVQVHAYVRDQFRNSPDSRRKQIGENLNRLRIARNKADYEDSVPRLDKMTVTDMRMAQEVLAMLNQL